MTQRRQTRTAVSGVVATALVATVTVGAGVGPAAGDPDVAPDGESAATTNAPPNGGSDERTITLITGDRITVSAGAGGAAEVARTVQIDSVVSGSGVRTQVIGADLHVIPDAAVPYLAAGTLDGDLFNVSSLIEQGVGSDDGGADEVGSAPLIVEYAPGADPATLPLSQGDIAGVPLESVNAVALRPEPADAGALWASLTAGGGDGVLGHGIEAVHLDGVVEATLEESVGQIGAPQAWERGVDGAGVTVAVLDTGADVEHPDLADVVVDSRSFVPGESIVDVDGHGTHVASTVAGSGAAADGVEQGVAPGADLIVGKVLADDGFGQESWIIAGMEWASENADVVNLSLGTPDPSDGTDPMSQALNALSEENGTLFVVAAGNGARVSGIGAPGAADAALTVGAVDAADQRAWFQDMGPRLGDGLVKPDLTGPGVGILAARSQDSPGEGWYTSLDGTSMATPHVAGAAALLLQDNPGWSGEQLKETLTGAAVPVQGDGPFQVGTGRVDVPAALDATVTGGPALSFGYFGWPNEDAEPVTREVTHTNLSDQDVTLTLQVSGSDDLGEPLPDGVLALAQTTVTVPAGGSATTQATLDPAAIAAGRTVSGYIVAEADGAPLTRTGWGAVKEDERYDLTLRATDLDGEPGQVGVAWKERAAPYAFPVQVDGELTLRLPAGTYSAIGFMEVLPEPDSAGLALLGDAQIDLTEDTVVELDAREANEITAEVPEGGLDAASRRLEYSIAGGTGFTDSYQIPVTVDRLYAAPLDGTTDGDFEFLTRWRLRTPLLSVSEGDAPLDVIGQVGGAFADGEATLPAVYAGSGTPEELAGVDAEGAAVVVTRDQDLDPATVAADVVDAGAEVLVVVNDEPGEFSTSFVTPDGLDHSIPIAGVSGHEGAGLIERVQAGGHVLTVDGGIDTPVVYDLVDPHPGGIPTDLTYAPGPEDLARIDAEYHGNTTRLGGEFRYDFRPHTAYGVGFKQYLTTPWERAEWVSAQPGTEWYQDAELLEEPWAERGTRLGYEPGERTTETWFSAVVQPRLGDGYWGPNRQGDYLQVNLPSFAGDEPTHTGSMGRFDGTDDQTIRWYDGDTLLQEDWGWQNASLELSSGERQQLRVTSDAARDPSWGTGLASSTEWTFWTEAADVYPNLMPFVQVDFDVETDATGTAEHGVTDTIGLTAWNLPGTLGAGQIEQGSLEISYDSGQTWAALDLTGEPGAWTADVTYPADADSVSLRGSATDSEGNAVTMAVQDAYLLPEVREPLVERVGGQDRYETAALIAEQYAAGGTAEVGTVYVVTGEQFADALVGSAPASEGRYPGGVDLRDESGNPAPVLLVKGDRIPGATAGALDALEPERLVVLGGDSAVSEEVLEQLGAWGDVERLGGADRYETAAMLADLYPVGVERVYVASGAEANFPDALSGGALAGMEGVPVLLTKPDAVPERVLASLERLDADEVVVLGGTTAVDANVFDALGASERIAGDTRYDTAVAIADRFPADSDAVALATGEEWPDALTGAALAAHQESPVLLSRTDLLTSATADALTALGPQRVTVLGGPAAITEVVLEAVRGVLGAA